MNILVDKNGSITGVVDWEYQALHPAVLAASYPPWLSYDGCNGPRLANKQTFWLENPKESKRLRDLYLKVSQVAHYIGNDSYIWHDRSSRVKTTNTGRPLFLVLGSESDRVLNGCWIPKVIPVAKGWKSGWTPHSAHMSRVFSHFSCFCSRWGIGEEV